MAFRIGTKKIDYFFRIARPRNWELGHNPRLLSIFAATSGMETTEDV